MVTNYPKMKIFTQKKINKNALKGQFLMQFLQENPVKISISWKFKLSNFHLKSQKVEFELQKIQDPFFKLPFQNFKLPKLGRLPLVKNHCIKIWRTQLLYTYKPIYLSLILGQFIPFEDLSTAAQCYRMFNLRHLKRGNIFWKF